MQSYITAIVDGRMVFPLITLQYALNDVDDPVTEISYLKKCIIVLDTYFLENNKPKMFEDIFKQYISLLYVLNPKIVLSGSGISNIEDHKDYNTRMFYIKSYVCSRYEAKYVIKIYLTNKFKQLCC